MANIDVSASDTLEASELIETSGVWYMQVVDALNAGEGYSPGKILTGGTDSLSVADLPATSEFPLSVSWQDDLLIHETLRSNISYSQVFDTLTMTETVGNFGVQSLQVTDALTITETIVTSGTFTAIVHDTVAVEDSPRRVKDATASDSLTVSDNANGISPSETDTLTITETITVSNGPSVSDTLVISETVTIGRVSLVTVVDTITISDFLSTRIPDDCNSKRYKPR